MSFVLGVVLLVAYAATAVRAGSWWEIPADALLPMGAGFGPALAAGEWWRLVSAALLHGGLLHLLVNLVVLADIAPMVESMPAFGGQRGGRWRGAIRLLSLFLTSAACGFVASAWWNPDAVSVGASGGILGLYGYWLAAAWHRSGNRPDASFWRRRIALASVYLGAALLAGLLIPGIDNAAHFAGLASGALLGRLLVARQSRAVFPLLVGSVLAALVAMPAHWSAEYLERQEFARRYQAFAERDRAANQAIAELLAEIRRGRDPHAVAEQFRLDVIGPLAANLAEWAKVTGAAGSPTLAAELAQWRRYASLRLAAAQALLDALQATDAELQAAALAEFERAMGEARDIVEAAARDSRAEGAVSGSDHGAGIQ